MSKRLLLVEDDPTLARAITRLLRRRGYEVYLAGTGAEARAAEGTFSLGVFDIDLPDGDGVSLAGEISEKGVVRRVLFYSGTVDPGTRKRAQSVGVFVDKLKGFPGLAEAIEQAMQKKSAKVSGGEPIRTNESTTPPPSGVRAPRTPKR
jgi:DNA-binding response OmpR family regulator